MARLAVLLILSVTLILPTLASSAPDRDHAVTGAGVLDDGTVFQVNAHTAFGDVPGMVRLTRPGAAGVVEITLECLAVSWHQPVYPIPPYLPFHLAEASGIDNDGVRHYVTIYDLVIRPVGFGDRMILSTEGGSGACGTTGINDIGRPLATGDITITP
ncbi:MAG TPA: hypothetical protein VGB52_02985 [Actinomycetota bacterium]